MLRSNKKVISRITLMAVLMIAFAGSWYMGVWDGASNHIAEGDTKLDPIEKKGDG